MPAAGAQEEERVAMPTQTNTERHTREPQETRGQGTRTNTGKKLRNGGDHDNKKIQRGAFGVS